MDDALIDDSRLPPERRSLLPGEGFFLPDSIDREREAAEAETALAGAGTVVVADSDADGLACVALIREAVGEAARLGTGPHSLDRTLERVAEHGEDGLALYVCDLSPDSAASVEGPLAAIADRAAAVRWFDHHRWEDDVAEAVRDLGVDLSVGDSETDCSADVAMRELDDDFPDHLVDLVAATRDHDLWIREDPRSDDLSDYAYWSEPEEYVETVRAHGADLPAEALSYLEERRVLKEDLIERAVRRAETVEVGEYVVGVTYGRCSQNEVAEALREAGTDAAVIVKPAGSASIRGTEAFQRCHEVARLVNGGGHPKAAGCKPDVYDDMLDYAHHWTTQGAVTKQVILDAFRAVVEEEASEGTSGDEDRSGPEDA